MLNYSLTVKSVTKNDGFLKSNLNDYAFMRLSLHLVIENILSCFQNKKV